VQNKGWDSPKAVLESYQNLEKMRNVPAERLLVLPDDKSDEAARNAFYDKLGRPKDAASYEFKLGEQDSAYDKGLKDAFHKAGVSGSQAKTIIDSYVEIAKAETERATAARNDKLAAEQQALVQEWGQAAQQRADLAVKGASALGLNQKEFDDLIGLFGPRRAGNMLAALAERSGQEAEFVAGDARGSGNGGAMTPAQAQNRLAELRRNPDWASKAINIGTPERAEMQRLIKAMNGAQ